MVVLVGVVTVAQLLTFTQLSTVGLNSDWRYSTVLCAILVIAWLIALELQKSRNLLLVGGQEYGRVVIATLWLFVVIAMSGRLIELPLSDGFTSILIVLGLLGLLVGRVCVRMHLTRRRKQGKFLTRVVVLGTPDSVCVIGEHFGRSGDSGYRIVGVCIPDSGGEFGHELTTPNGVVPVLGDFRSVESALILAEADALAVAAVEHLGCRNLKKLAWRLEELGIDLIVVPGLADVSGHRLTMQPIDNLPLVHIAPPHLTGAPAAAKRVFDLAFGTTAFFAALPVMLVAALAIKLDDDGPVIFRQERIGLHGSRFHIYKFRTMVVDADVRIDSDRAAAAHRGVFYKSACDSRITRVGRILRATSIDELPQLLNVLGGAMSIVGPRPLVAGEGAAVEDFIERRGLLKPGITGLWQVSGRSNAPDEERIRLDFCYVDNWSCMRDLAIVWRTIYAVLKRNGAY